MKISKRDSIFIFILAVILVFLFAGTGKKLGQDVPDTADHLNFYRQLEAGGNRISLEKGCVSCHEVQSLPQAHPHKEECMICHLRK